MAALPTLTRSIHDWAALYAQVGFVSEFSIPATTATGHQERSGEYSAWLVLEGWAKIKTDSHEIRATPGQWLFCFEQKIHQDFAPDTRLLSVRIKNCWPRGELLFDGNPFLVVEKKDHPLLEEVARKMKLTAGMPLGKHETPQFVFTWKSHVSYHDYLELQLFLNHWMKLVADLLLSRGWDLHVPRGVDSRLAGILNEIDALNFKKRIAPSTLSKNYGLTLQQANRLCLKAYDQTILGYWEARQINKAKQLLGEQNQSVKETASTLGFSQLSHFSAWFKRLAGSAPRSFRKESNPQ